MQYDLDIVAAGPSSTARAGAVAAVALAACLSNTPNLNQQVPVAYGFARYVDLNKTDVTADNLAMTLENVNMIAAEADEPLHGGVLAEAQQLIADAEHLTEYVLPVGEADTYYGELGVEWRNEEKILRLTCLGNGLLPRLDFGVMGKETPGIYKSVANATPESLAERLDWLQRVEPDTISDLG